MGQTDGRDEGRWMGCYRGRSWTAGRERRTDGMRIDGCMGSDEVKDKDTDNERQMQPGTTRVTDQTKQGTFALGNAVGWGGGVKGKEKARDLTMTERN